MISYTLTPLKSPLINIWLSHSTQVKSPLPFIRQLQTMPGNSSIDDSPSPKFPMLSDPNYHDWAFNITARLHSKGLWMLVNGKKKLPSASADQEKWDLDQEMAAGLIVSTLEPGQHVHIQGLEDDPVRMWEALRHVYVQQQAGTRFNAYDVLFNIQNNLMRCFSHWLLRSPLPCSSAKIFVHLMAPIPLPSRMKNWWSWHLSKHSLLNLTALCQHYYSRATWTSVLEPGQDFGVKV